jgi:hypothetical protein
MSRGGGMSSDEDKPRLVKISARVPEYVAKYFKENYYNGSKQIRVALEEHIEREGAKYEKDKEGS